MLGINKEIREKNFKSYRFTTKVVVILLAPIALVYGLFKGRVWRDLKEGFREGFEKRNK